MELEAPIISRFFVGAGWGPDREAGLPYRQARIEGLSAAPSITPDSGTVLVFDTGDEVSPYLLSSQRTTGSPPLGSPQWLFRLTDEGLPEKPGGGTSRGGVPDRRYRARKERPARPWAAAF